MKNKIIGIGIICVIIILASVGYSRIKQRTQSPPPSTTNQIISPGQQETSIISPSLSGDALRTSGKSYTEPQGVFSFFYPTDYMLDVPNNDNYTRIYKRGATQQGQTEMYDGVIIVFESVDLKGQSLSAWVDTRIKESTVDGTSQIIQPKNTTVMNGFPGFTYQTRGLGTSMYLVLQKNVSSKNAVSITFSVSDPQNIGYQAEVDSILATLVLLK